MLDWLTHRILRTRWQPAQITAQLVAGRLSRALDQAFVRASVDWNGRRSCLLLSFDVDFPEDALALPEIVQALRKYPIKASFACVGRWVEDYPDAHRAVLEAGYELFNHSYSHPELVNSPQHFVSCRDDFNPRPWDQLNRTEQVEEIRRCQEVVQEILGCRMQGFRAPHFGNVRSADLHPILAELGMHYSSSLLATWGELFGVPFWRGDILEIPVTTCPRHPFTSFDSWHAFYARGGWHRDDFFELLRTRLERGIECRGLTNIYLDPKDRKRLDFERIFALAASLEAECWAPTYAEFAGWWQESKPDSGEAMPADGAGEGTAR